MSKLKFSVCIITGLLMSCSPNSDEGKVKATSPQISEATSVVSYDLLLNGNNLNEAIKNWSRARDGLDDEALPGVISDKISIIDNSLFVTGFIDLYGRHRIPFDKSMTLTVKLTLAQQALGEKEAARHIVGAYLLDSDGRSVAAEIENLTKDRDIFLSPSSSYESFEKIFRVSSNEAKWLRPVIRFNFSDSSRAIVSVKEIDVKIGN